MGRFYTRYNIFSSQSSAAYPHRSLLKILLAGWAFVFCKCQVGEKKKKKPLRWISTIALFLRVHAGKFLRALIKVEAMYESSRVNIHVQPLNFHVYAPPFVYCLYSISARTHVQFP